VIFDAAFEQARDKRWALLARICDLRQARARVDARLKEYSRFQHLFEVGVAVARATGEPQLVPEYYPHSRSVWETVLTPGDHRRVHRLREGWLCVTGRLTELRDRIDRKIAEIEQRILEVDLWLEEKGKVWGRIDPEKLRSQVREVLQAAEELSRLVVGRSVAVAFDTAEGAPLGYVPIQKETTGSRKVYLSADILGRQPEHLLDYYRALLVHELGHILLHLRDRDYRRLRRLLRRRVSLAPGFFDVFNILLDEQLERTLRDTRPEWQRWFNRLDFFTRQIPLKDWETLLSRAGRPDPAGALNDLAARRLVKVYADPQRPFVVIQSAAIFSEGLGFTRLYAFWSVLRNRLPLATVAEPWLKQCLDLIPKDLKSLDVFAVHALAVEVWKILMHPSPPLMKVKVRCGRGTVEIEVPGSWRPVFVDAVARKKARRRGRKGRGGVQGPSGARPAAPPDNAEGPPPPPPPAPPPVPRPTPGPPPDGVFAPRRRRVRVSKNPFKGLDTHWSFKTGPEKGAGGGKISRKGRGKGNVKPSTKGRGKGQHSARRLTPIEKARKQRPATPSKPKALPRSAGQLSSPPDAAEVEKVERLAAAPTPSWSPRGTLKGMRQALARLLDEVRAEMAGKSPETPSVERLTPDGGQPSDQRNEADERAFPGPEGVFRLLPDRVLNATLARDVRRLVPILRPFFAVVGQEKVQEERLSSGRRLLAGSLVKHLAYGETRLFADQRLAEVEQHADVLVCVLIDTSASTKADDRLGRAKLVGALLAECLKECPNVESAFLGYNQNVYLCGSHEEHSLGSLEPAGKTNEAAAIDYLRKVHLDSPRRRKAVIVLSDGLPTACSVESVRWLVHATEKELGARFLYGALSSADHPAYRRRADLAGEVDESRVRALGRQIAALLR
jgi:hypothetical protein